MITIKRQMIKNIVNQIGLLDDQICTVIDSLNEISEEDLNQLQRQLQISLALVEFMLPFKGEYGDE